MEDHGDDDDVCFAYADGQNPDNSESAESHAEDPDCTESGNDDHTAGHGGTANVYPSLNGDYCGSNAITVFGGNGILRSLSNVRTMELLAHRGEVLLRSQLRKCPVFKNLKTLSLGEWCIGPDFDALSTILEHSPNLEKLYLCLDKAYESRGKINPSGRPFTCNHLKMVDIICLTDDTMGDKLAEFFRATSDFVFVPQNGKQWHRLRGGVQGAGRSCGGFSKERTSKPEPGVRKSWYRNKVHVSNTTVVDASNLLPAVVPR